MTEVTINLREIKRKVRAVLFTPAEFFEGVKKEKGIGHALGYFLVLYLLGVVLSFVSQIFIYPRIFAEMSAINSVEANSLVLMILSYLVGIVMSFLFAGILLIWIRLFKGKAKFYRFYQLYVYSRTPIHLLGWIPLVSYFVQFYSFYLLIVGTSEFFSFSRRKSFMVFLVPIILIIVMVAFGLGLLFNG